MAVNGRMQSRPVSSVRRDDTTLSCAQVACNCGLGGNVLDRGPHAIVRPERGSASIAEPDMVQDVSRAAESALD